MIYIIFFFINKLVDIQVQKKTFYLEEKKSYLCLILLIVDKKFRNLKIGNFNEL